MLFGGFYSGIRHNIQKTRKLVNVWTYQEIIVFHYFQSEIVSKSNLCSNEK